MLSRFIGSRTVPFALSCVFHLTLITALLVAEHWMVSTYAKPPVLPVQLVQLEEPAPPEKAPAPPPAATPPKPLRLPKPIETPLPKLDEAAAPPEPKPIVPDPPPPPVASPPAALPEKPVAAAETAARAPAASSSAPVTARQPTAPAEGAVSLAPSASDASDGVPIGRTAALPPSREAGPEAGITKVARPQGGYQVRPSYPANARRQGVQGTTLLKVHVLNDGRVGEVVVQESAGHPDLDQAAADAVRRWRFEPARRGPDPVAIWVLLPVEFRLR